MPLWAYLENGGRLAVAVCHRRWGKDDVALHRTACAAHERTGVYWHMLPEAAQARKAIWEAINPRTGKRRIDEAFPKELRETTREQEMFIKFKCGSTWQVVGSDNFDSLVGSPPVGVVFSEWALADPRSWPYLRPILRENKGWALFITTPRGHNHAENTYKLAKENPKYFGTIIQASESGVFDPADLEEESRELVKEYGPEYGKAMFEQEYNCSWNAAILGSYYGYLIDKLERDGHVSNEVVAEDGIPVDTFWDLGLDDHMAIWVVQFVGSEVRWLESISGGGVGMEDYIEILKGNPEKGIVAKPYNFRKDDDGKLICHGPHDLRIRELTRGKKSRLEVALEMGVRFKIVPDLAVVDGRQAVRSILARSVFNRANTEDGISALQQHRAEWDAEKKILSQKPVSDWSAHYADAARYVAVQWKEQGALVVEPYKPKEMLFYKTPEGIVKSTMSVRGYVERLAQKRAAED